MICLAHERGIFRIRHFSLIHEERLHLNGVRRSFLRSTTVTTHLKLTSVNPHQIRLRCGWFVARRLVYNNRWLRRLRSKKEVRGCSNTAKTENHNRGDYQKNCSVAAGWLRNLCNER